MFVTLDERSTILAIVIDKKFQVDEALRNARAERYAIQSVAKIALPNERVSKCLRAVLNKTQVEVWKHKNTEKAFYNGLLVCGSVWNCPVCASKISEKRYKELKQAFDLHKEQGGYIAFMTLTFSHKKSDELKVILKQFSKALTRFRSGKRYHKLRNKMNMIGSIRTFEITYGLNGFHPHIHLAIFYKNDVDLKELEFEFYSLWCAAAKKEGLSTKEKYGLTLQNGDKVEEYLSKHGKGKWSLTKEMTKTHIKKGREQSFTPFDLLREFINTGEQIYISLFKEYADALKGKTQLFWSRGLKDLFLINEKSDEELAKESLEQADLLGLIPYEDWQFILKNKYRSRLLDNIEKFGYDFAIKLILDKKIIKNSLPIKNKE